MPESVQPPPPVPSVLIVDDDAELRRLLRESLALAGCEALDADSALAAKEVLESRAFRIGAILLDLAMPNVSGEEFLEWISAAAPQVPVIVVSGLRDEALVMRCLQKGACDFLEKPIRLDEVPGILRRAARRQAGRKAKTGEIEAFRPTTGWVELTAPSEFEYLTRMQRFSEILFASRLPNEVCEDLRMVIEEVGRNAIEWGNRMNPDKNFRISYCFFHDRVVLKFEDEGEGFHPEKLPDPSIDPESHLKRREKEGKRPGGFGVFLIQRIMDEVVYSEKGNVVLMTKFIREAEETKE